MNPFQRRGITTTTTTTTIILIIVIIIIIIIITIIIIVFCNKRGLHQNPLLRSEGWPTLLEVTFN